LIDAFLEGNVAHFYFTVDGYPVYEKDANPSPKTTLEPVKFETGDDVKAGQDPVPSYAHRSAVVVLTAAQREQDSEAFQKFVENAYKSDEWRTIASGSSPLDISYDIVFFRVAAIYEDDGQSDPPILRELEPRLNRIPGCPLAEYHLKINKTYRVKVVTHLPRLGPAQLPGGGRAFLELQFDKTCFESPGLTTLKISSSYDLQYWPIVPRKAGRSILVVSCQSEVRSKEEEFFVRREFLAPQVVLPINVTADEE